MKDKNDFAYQAVYRYLVRLINEVQTDSTLKMPSLRQLARRLRVSISTIQSAYALLEQEGRICSVPKSGYYALPTSVEETLAGEGDSVLDKLHHNVRKPGVSMLSGDEPGLLLASQGVLLNTERELVRQYPQRLDTGFQPFGDMELRSALAARYTHDAQDCWHAEQVYIGPDLLGMLKAVVHTLRLAGSSVLVESPCSWTLLRLLQSLQVQVVEIPLDEEGGVRLAELEHLLEAHTISLAILSSRLNPVRGSVAPLHNRQAMAHRLNRHQVWVLENDSHGELAFDIGDMCLRELIDPQRLLIFGSFDKLLGPEAPYGYLLCRHFESLWQEYFLLRAFDLPPMRQKAIARLCNSGRLDQHLVELRVLLQERMQAMGLLIDQHLGCRVRFEMPRGGSGIWAETQQGVDVRQVFDTLLARRLVIAPGELFSLSGLHRQYLRLGYALDWYQDVPKMLESVGEALRLSQIR
ncbi:PLP-dependent aminotransferase family protein [Pseudomonas syringae]|nr:PLP-dependent aminotransferase family protein [Pseudomonas syringae]MBD8790584.1 PLP-dependent aminotransferase family protein [Pseudomonas syringae]MBD8798821.1 PLP-dependent aminotransferase family protein [Pseudomonas syringae]MBD8809648.1 PLP-dependent aminotransferase family protein [Pseudomonas syringae]